MATNFQAVPDRSVPLRSIPDRGLPQYTSGETPPPEIGGTGDGQGGMLKVLKIPLHRLRLLK